ncbi:rCG32114, partial [Rattus norvegicus]
MVQVYAFWPAPCLLTKTPHPAIASQKALITTEWLCANKTLFV